MAKKPLGAKVECQYCGEEFSKSGIKAHETACAMNPANMEELDDVMADADAGDFEDDDAVEEEIIEDDSTEAEDELEDADVEAVEEVAKGMTAIEAGFTGSLLYMTTTYAFTRGKRTVVPKEMAKNLIKKGMAIYAD